MLLQLTDVTTTDVDDANVFLFAGESHSWRGRQCRGSWVVEGPGRSLLHRLNIGLDGQHNNHYLQDPCLGDSGTILTSGLWKNPTIRNGIDNAILLLAADSKMD